MELSRYLVELERPAEGWADLPAATAGARAAAAALRAEGVPVRFLRSVYVPEEETCFFLYEAPSRAAAREAAGRTAVVALVREADRLGQRAREEST